MSAAGKAVAALAARMEVADAHLYVEATPLLADVWTGIPVVAAALSERFLARMPERVSFFRDDTLIGHADIAELLARRTGALLAPEIMGRTRPFAPLDLYRCSGPALGFYPSVKPVPGMFDREVSVVHDLSTLVTPEFHAARNIRFHLETLHAEVASNDLTLCVSDATLEDVAHYLGPPRSRLAAMPNAVEWSPDLALRFEAEFGGKPAEPFVLVLGTREPRKNHALIFALIEARPELLDAYRFVFAGPPGWLEDRLALPEPVRRGFERGRILHTGFLDEFAKYALLRRARFSVYASLYEGFGLPVLESLSLGTPCLSSLSSSLPEVGRDAALHFDPLSVEDLSDRIAAVAALDASGRRALSRRCIEAAAHFSWDASFAILCGHLARLV